ncbi:O-antigen ligase family protein [Pectobacterium versatile]|uniref:O-antigen ligase family protein n=1 Tax=Pectobacterium versatile TaxID=2488639 RepID=UPI000C7EF41D|nr:O-antigen ligase family protein [Pectobacterium versatile]MCA6914332.1 O-antigen ligase family protein [Pectobacterium versatile]PLY38645.1 hypothetical protein F164LOC_02160 [Pectobacterium carotovorum]
MRFLITSLLLLSFSLYISYEDIENISVYFVICTLPFYIIFNLGSLVRTKYNKNDVIIFGSLAFFVFYCVNRNIAVDADFLYGVFWWAVLLMVYPIKNNVFLVKVFPVFIYISLIIIIIDTVYRLSGQAENTYGFYSFKYGLIGVDSNFTALFLLLVIASYDVVYEKNKSKIIYILMLFLLILTFSRAAMLAYVIYFLIYKINLKSKIVLLFATPIAIIILLLSNFAVYDQSGESKLDILSNYMDFFLNSSWIHILFGYGLGQVKVGIYNPHLLVLQLAIGYGLIGLLLYIVPFVCLFRAEKKLLKAVFPYFIASFSVAPIGLGVLSLVIYLFYCNRDAFFEKESAISRIKGQY